ncbi:uncharacterized protein LOC133196979 [Saccostrea echinata]|uniref:uncharacterized protein LOC133196979 n=1 Tax=Saccostrea echinata TaxID=191078 RepID=UPI002A8037EE|nr:uncharacterized protein LOC133196979 [Saccostrea echinata]
MELKPSEIRYSQDSIARYFGRSTSHPFQPIGQTLDSILSGQCNVNAIPKISVVSRHGRWYTTDNRRLWVFQKAEERGYCDKITVYNAYYIDEEKFTTTNEGRSVTVRGDPGGYLWRRCPVVKGESRAYGYQGSRSMSTSGLQTYASRSSNTPTYQTRPTMPVQISRPSSYTSSYSAYSTPERPRQERREFSSMIIEQEKRTTNSSFWDRCVIL